MSEEIEELIVGSKPISSYAWPLFIKLATNNDLILVGNINNIGNIERLLYFLNKLGVEEENRTQEPVLIKNKKGTSFKIHIRKIPAIRDR